MSNTEPDWETAPIDATHWEPESTYREPGFMKLVGNTWHFRAYLSTYWIVDAQAQYYQDSFILRPE